MTDFAELDCMKPAALTSNDIEAITEHLDAISARIPLRPIRTKTDYEAATSAMNALLDAGGANEKSSLAFLVTLLGDVIGDDEDAQ